MAKDTLQGFKVAILVTDGFEKVELTEPRKALDEAGAETRIVAPNLATRHGAAIRGSAAVARFGMAWRSIPPPTRFI
jgi:putative intracellular protease/amidase